jgi:three-Cys-motif partner protein
MSMFLTESPALLYPRAGEGFRVKTAKFFDERTDQSEVKARIVEKYFSVWAKVVGATVKAQGGKIAYIDLYAGPGRYRDGAASTPLLVLQSAINDPDLRNMLVALFNEGDKGRAATLEDEIAKLPGIERLKYKPTVLCGPVDEDAERYFAETRLVPSFSFVDPFGYKGLSLRIVNGVIKDWGCDCVFFFNYNRINAGFANENVEHHIDALFGNDRANEIRQLLPGLKPHEREDLILEQLAQAIKEMGGSYVLPFIFKNANGIRTSHCLIFVSKHFKGYDLMKQIMAKESSTHDQGVPSLAYSPAAASNPLLFSLARPLEHLEGILLKEYAGRTMTMRAIFEEHNVDTPYIARNYKDALMKLEAAGKITANPPASSRKKGTFADHVKVTVPK